MKKALALLITPFLALQAWAGTERITINNGWLFSYGSGSDARWEKVNLPHCWNQDAYSVKEYYQGTCHYRRQLAIPQHMQGKRIFLKIDGANKYSEVFLNGKKLAEHAGGYTSFTIEITQALKMGGENLLEVSVDNRTQDVAPTSADFTFMGGIYRDVWLIAAEQQHFTLTNMGSDGVFVSPHDVSESKAGISVRGSIVNAAAKATKLIVESSLIAPDGKTVSSARYRVSADAETESGFSMELPSVSNPQLWSPDTPVLYTMCTVIKDAKSNTVLDERRIPTAFRWFEFHPDKGFFLNGQHLKLNGICRHQDQAPFGYALGDDTHRRDIRLAKEMGANFIRISHYPQDDAILEMCDRLGLLAWEEIPIVNIVPDNERYWNNCETNLREMIRQHYNHPSIITWGYMNEVMLMAGYITREGTPEREALEKRTVQLSERLAAVVREEDPSRVVCMAFQQDNSYIRMNMHKDLDLLGWNIYAGWYGDKMSDFDDYMASCHKNTPDHAIMVSEYGAGADSRIHSLAPERFDFSMEYQQLYIEHYLKVITGTPYLMGGAYWNFIDFSSAQREESMPRINNKGIVRNDRSPKDVYYLFQAAWRKDKAVLHIASRDWNRRISFSDQLQPVKVYSNRKEAILSVNGVQMEAREICDWKAEWMVKLQPGRNIIECRADDAYDLCFVDFIPLDNMVESELAVNVGSNHSYYETSSDLIWVADQAYDCGRGWGYVGGERKIATSEIHLTSEGPLYQSWQEGIECYCFDVPQGEYELELLFADHSKQNASLIYLLNGNDARKDEAGSMDISVNGRLLEKDFCPAAESGVLTAVRRRYTVKQDCAQNPLKVEFKAHNGNSFLSGIKLRKLL